MKLDHPFIQLPVAFDAQTLAGEVAAIPEREWRPHPQNFPGNSMLPLIAVHGEAANEAFAGPMRPTAHLAAMPYMRQVIASLGVAAGRTRLMRLAGQAEVNRHSDQGYYWFERVRIHVPIVTQPSVVFECGDAAVNMAPGACWIFDTWRQHRVFNAHDDQRIHLVIDTVGGPGFWALVAKGLPEPAPAPTPSWSPRLISFDPTIDPAIPFESFNVPQVMTPWEVERYFTLVLGEVQDEARVAALAPIVTIFLRDWRALWAVFGDGQTGRNAYMKRYDAFMTTLKPLAEPVILPNGLNLLTVIATALTRAIVEPPRASAPGPRAQRA